MPVHPADKHRVEQALEETKYLYGAERTKAMREKTGLGLQECERAIEVDDVERAIWNIDTCHGEDIRHVLKRILGLIR